MKNFHNIKSPLIISPDIEVLFSLDDKLKKCDCCACYFLHQETFLSVISVVVPVYYTIESVDSCLFCYIGTRIWGGVYYQKLNNLSDNCYPKDYKPFQSFQHWFSLNNKYATSNEII